MRWAGLLLLLLALGGLPNAQAAVALPLVNGSLEGTPGVAQVPPGWTQYQGNTTDTADANGPFGTYNLSPDGGTFARSFSYQPDSQFFDQREGIEQSVSGFAVGETYRVSFYQSSVNGINSNSGLPLEGAPGFWTLEVDGVTAATSDLMAPPAGASLDNVWIQQELGFTATAETHLLGFLATVPDSAPVETRTFLAIDGISIAAVPEPGAPVLGGLALAALAWRSASVRRRGTRTRR
jgi:hypothetical protein